MRGRKDRHLFQKGRELLVRSSRSFPYPIMKGCLKHQKRTDHLPLQDRCIHFPDAFFKRMRTVSQFVSGLPDTEPAETGTWCLLLHFLRRHRKNQGTVQLQHIRYPVSQVGNTDTLSSAKMIDAVSGMRHQFLDAPGTSSTNVGVRHWSLTTFTVSPFCRRPATSCTMFPCCPGKELPYTTTIRAMA